jgi:hypothetical protein
VAGPHRGIAGCEARDAWCRSPPRRSAPSQSARGLAHSKGPRCDTRTMKRRRGLRGCGAGSFSWERNVGYVQRERAVVSQCASAAVSEWDPRPAGCFLMKVKECWQVFSILLSSFCVPIWPDGCGSKPGMNTRVHRVARTVRCAVTGLPRNSAQGTVRTTSAAPASRIARIQSASDLPQIGRLHRGCLRRAGVPAFAA